MSKSWKRHLMFGFSLTLILTASTQVPKAGEKEPASRVNLHVINYADVPEMTLSQAEKQVENILQKIAIDVAWRHLPLPSGKDRSSASPAERTDCCGATVRISIYPRSMSKRFEERLPDMENVFGFAPRTEGQAPRWIYILYQRVEELVKKRNLQEHRARILGLAIAHELGHLLLPVHSHSRKGIMRTQWNRQDFHLASVGNLGFTPRQGEKMRAEVIRRTDRRNCS